MEHEKHLDSYQVTLNDEEIEVVIENHINLIQNEISCFKIFEGNRWERLKEIKRRLSCVEYYLNRIGHDN